MLCGVSTALTLALLIGWSLAKPNGANPEEQHEELMKAIASLVLDDGGPLETFDFVQEHSIPVQNGGNLVMRCDLADIIVETHDYPRVEIEAVISNCGDQPTTGGGFVSQTWISQRHKKRGRR